MTSHARASFDSTWRSPNLPETAILGIRKVGRAPLRKLWRTVFDFHGSLSATHIQSPFIGGRGEYRLPFDFREGVLYVRLICGPALTDSLSTSPSHVTEAPAALLSAHARHAGGGGESHRRRC